MLSHEDGAPLSCDVRSFHLSKVLFRAPTASGDWCTPALPWGELDIPGIIDRAHCVTDPIPGRITATGWARSRVAATCPIMAARLRRTLWTKAVRPSELLDSWDRATTTASVAT